MQQGFALLLLVFLVLELDVLLFESISARQVPPVNVFEAHVFRSAIGIEVRQRCVVDDLNLESPLVLVCGLFIRMADRYTIRAHGL